jgi:hypothetical protein
VTLVQQRFKDKAANHEQNKTALGDELATLREEIAKKREELNVEAPEP